MRTVIFTRVASVELTEAQDWYEKQLPGLGRRFREAINALLERVSDSPLLFPVVHKSVRRALLHRFPYALLFVIAQDGALIVIACFHSSRDPTQWQGRRLPVA